MARWPLAALDVTTRPERSGALLDWRADTGGGTKIVQSAQGQTATVTRTGTATSLDTQGEVYADVENDPRWQTADVDADPTRNEILGLLVEPARTNLVLQSENFGTTWAANNSPSRTAGAHTTSGVSLDLIGDTSAASRANYTQSITFTGNATKGVSIVVKKGTATTSLFRVYNGTTLTAVLLAAISWSGTTPSVSATTGVYVGSQRLAGGAYRLLFQTASVTASNGHTVEVSPAATSTSDNASQGNVYAGGVQAENGPAPTSYIKTTTTATPRGAETCAFPIAFAPRALTVDGAISYPGVGTGGTTATAVAAQAEGDGSTHGVFSLGDDNASAGREIVTLDLMTSGGVPYARARHYIGTTSNSTVSVSIATLTGPLTYRVTVASDGTVGLLVTGANGLSVQGSGSAPGASFTGAFAGGRAWLGSREGGANIGVFAHESFRVTSGGTPIARQEITASGGFAPLPRPSGTGTVKQTITGTGSLAPQTRLALAGQGAVTPSITGTGNLRLSAVLYGSAGSQQVTGTGNLAARAALAGGQYDATMQDFLDGLYDGATIDFYTGTRPRSAGDPATGCTFLAQHTLASPAATLADLVGTSTINLAILGGFVYANGTVSWARVRGPDATPLYDGDVGLAGSGRPFIVDFTLWTIGQTITKVACTATTGT